MKHTFTYNHQSQFIEMFGKDKCPYIHLKDVCIRHGEYGSNTASIPFEEGLPRYIRITDLNYDGGLNENMVAPRDLDSKYRLAKGDFLFARTGATVGKTYCHKNGHALYAGYLIRYVTDKKILDPEFLASFTRTPIFWRWVQGQMKVGAQPNISSRQYDNLPVPVPSKNEQNSFLAIVRQADKSKFDGFKSQFIEWFGSPELNDHGLPIRKLGNLGTLDRGVSKVRPRNRADLYEGDYPFIQTGDITKADRYIFSHSQTYSETGLKQSKLWPSGTLCITIAANIAETAILTYDCCFPDSVVGFIPSEKINLTYIQYWFKSLQQILERQAPQTAQKNINLQILSQLDVMLPPKFEQERFSILVKQADKSKYYVQNKQNYICHILTNQIQLRRCS